MEVHKSRDILFLYHASIIPFEEKEADVIRIEHKANIQQRVNPRGIELGYFCIYSHNLKDLNSQGNHSCFSWYLTCNFKVCMSKVVQIDIRK